MPARHGDPQRGAGPDRADEGRVPAPRMAAPSKAAPVGTSPTSSTAAQTHGGLAEQNVRLPSNSAPQQPLRAGQVPLLRRTQGSKP